MGCNLRLFHLSPRGAVERSLASYSTYGHTRSNLYSSLLHSILIPFYQSHVVVSIDSR